MVPPGVLGTTKGIRMRIVVFGANGPTGRLLTSRALDEGHEVTAFTRHPLDFPIAHEALTVMGGDVGDEHAVSEAIRGQHVVLSALGGVYTRKPVSVYSVGARSILTAMQEQGVRRLAVVSSSATVPNPNANESFFFGRVLQPFVQNVLGRTLYADMARMEALVAASDTDWTIVRPSGLFHAEERSDYDVSAEPLPGRFTSRVDLADLLLRQAYDDTFVKSPASIITRAGVPSVAQLMMKEAFGK
jgi:putative NADH-flavin reductase